MASNQSSRNLLVEKELNKQLYTKLLECLSQRIENCCVPDFWGTVSFEVFIEGGTIQRFRENCTRSHK